MPRAAKPRIVRETLLIVGEGEADVAFVRFVKRIYADSLGRSVQEIDAKGKGGRHVLDTALRRANSNRAYDKVVLLLDTDTDWTMHAARRRAGPASAGAAGSMSSNPILVWRHGC